MIPGQAELIKMAEDSLAAAKIMLTSGYPGFAASRAYYSMFAVAEAYLLFKELAFSRHSAVIAAFAQHFAKTGIVPFEFHRWLLNAQRNRQVGDYGGDSPVSEEDAKADIERAEIILARLKEHIADQAKGGPLA